MTDAQLRRRIAAIEAKREALRVEDGFLEQELLIYQERLRLRSVNGSGTVVDSMEMDHRLALSASHKPDRDKFSKACRAAGYTASSLADKLGIDKSALSLYRAGKRKTPANVRVRVEQLIGWSADGWPKTTD